MKWLTTVKSLTFQVWFWGLQCIPFTAAFFLMDTEAFARLTLFYLGEVTILTAALGAISSLVAARVAEKQEDDADVQDVLDAVHDLNG